MINSSDEFFGRIIFLQGFMRKEDELLLYRCFRGEGDAWDDFVNIYLAPVSTAIKHVLDKYTSFSSGNEVEDLTQRFFLSLMEDDYKRLRIFKGERNCSLATYLRVVASRQAIDYLRKQGRERNLLDQYKTVHEREAEEDPSDMDLSPGGKAADLAEVKKVIARLSPPERLFLHLHYYRELSLKATAQTLNISLEAAYTRKSRLLKKIRRALKKTVPQE